MIPGSAHPHPSFKKSFYFALQGFRSAVMAERNIKVMLVLAVLTIGAGWIVGLSPMQWVVILFGCALVIAAELFNTAIETVVDLVSPEFHPLAGRAKDIAAASVWFLSSLVGLAGLIVFIDACITRWCV